MRHAICRAGAIGLIGVLASVAWTVRAPAFAQGSGAAGQQPPVADLILTNGKIKDITPELTMVGGRIVYDAAAGASATR